MWKHLNWPHDVSQHDVCQSVTMGTATTKHIGVSMKNMKYQFAQRKQIKISDCECLYCHCIMKTQQKYDPSSSEVPQRCCISIHYLPVPINDQTGTGFVSEEPIKLWQTVQAKSTAHEVK